MILPLAAGESLRNLGHFLAIFVQRGRQEIDQIPEIPNTNLNFKWQQDYLTRTFTMHSVQFKIRDYLQISFPLINHTECIQAPSVTVEC